MKIKEVIGALLIIGCFIGLIACGIAAFGFYFQNPDMTALRRFMEYPDPSIWAVICYIGARIGLGMIGTNKR